MTSILYSRLPAKVRPYLGLALLLAGFFILLSGWPDFSSKSFHHRKAETIPSTDSRLSALGGRYSPEELLRYEIGRGEASLSLHVARYRDSGGAMRRAVVHPAGTAPSVLDANQWRNELWKKAAAAILKHTEENALFLTWWDNGQRVHFLTGRESLPAQPVAGAFRDKDEGRFWANAAGGFAADEAPSRRLARWLSRDADQAVADMARSLPPERPLYLLVCLDDLARLSEMETLSGGTLPLQARFFPNEGDLHGQINAVKRWAGDGNYLLQPVPGAGIRAWLTGAGEMDKTLLVRLLPFIHSAAELPEGVRLVYQSEQGGYLAIYRLR